MAERNNSGLAFILGAVVIVVIGIVYFLYAGGDVPDGGGDLDVNVELPASDG